MRRRDPGRRESGDGRTTRRGRDILTPFILLAAVLAIVLVGYGQLQTTRVIDHQTQILPIANDVAERVATSQLLLVRALAGDRSVDVREDVFAPLRQTETVLDDALKGSAPDSGLVSAARDEVIRGDLELLHDLVHRFTALGSTRWVNRTDTGKFGSPSDRDSDALYASIRDQVNRLSDDVRSQMARDRSILRALNVGVLILLLLLFAGAGTFARRTRRQIVRKNAELVARVRERTAELAANQARTTAIVNTAVDAIITADASGTIESVNPATLRMFGYWAEELIGEKVQKLIPDEDAPPRDPRQRRYEIPERSQVFGVGREAVAVRKDGTAFPIDISVSEAKVDHDRVFVGQIRDITERKRGEAELQAAKDAAEEAARRDPLTGLLNHNRIIEHLIEELARSDRQSSALSLAMIDLDHFKQINDTYGHIVGDEVLREVAVRLKGAVRVYDRVGRFGGEEFVVVLPGAGRVDAEAAAERIREGISRDPVPTSAGPVTITASLGAVTRQGELTDDATALLVAADDALYESKEGGRDRVTFAGA